MSRTNSRISQVGRDTNRNKSNSNGPAVNRALSSENLKQRQQKQNPVPGLRILGTDREVTEDELWDLNKGKATPTSNRSSTSSRPGSSGSRNTPSRQVSLQAVKRKEQGDEPVEPIDWSEFNRAVSMNDERVLAPPEASDSDSGDDFQPPPQRVLSPEEQQALVEERAKQLSSALSSRCLDEAESQISERLTEIEQERELREQLEKEREEQLMKTKLKSDTDTKYRNEHYINMSARDEKNRISSSFILDNSRPGTVGDKDLSKLKPKPVINTGQNVVEKHAIDKQQETTVGATAGESNDKPEAFITEVKSESVKKNEASAADESSSEDDSSDDEDDVMGHKGKAPNQLLMEFVTCLMEEDYENAEKLCKMVLIYEPNNKEALSFFPLIQEKLAQEAAESSEEESDSEEDDSGKDDESNTERSEAAESSEEESDSEEEDDSGKDDEDDDDDDDDDDDNDDDDEEEEDSSPEEDSDNQAHPDSGIASANSD